jgi:tRNA (guanine37-N1)-methyltransferase
MKFNIITIFPEIITHYADESILGRAQKNKFIKINAVDLRDFSEDKHRKIDDTPYGGGAGMVMKSEPIFKALKSIEALPFKTVDGLAKIKKVLTGDVLKKKRTVLLSPRGKQFDQRMAEKLSKYQELTFVCGRYEGVDERVVEYMVDEEVSIGPYVLAGGELGALVIIEAVSRLIYGVLGNPKSLEEETFGKGVEGGEVEYPQYTKPENFKGWKVPTVLLSGDHKKIKEWRKKSKN